MMPKKVKVNKGGGRMSLEGRDNLKVQEILCGCPFKQVTLKNVTNRGPIS